MEYALAIVVGVIAVLAVLFFVLRKKPPELAAGKEPEKLPAKPAKEPGAPTLKDKLEGRREEQSGKKPADKTEDPKPEKKPAEKPSERPAATPEPDAPKVQVEPPARPVEPPVEAPVEARAPKVEEAPRSAEPKPAPKPAIVHRRDVEGVRRGLSKVRGQEGFFGRLAQLVTGKREIDPNLLEQLEEVLLTSDVGVKTTAQLLERVRGGLQHNELSDPGRVWEALREEAKRILSVGGGGIVLSGVPTVVMMVGVNGAGKTTTIGKIATKLSAEKRSVLLAAGDTFRAAAVQQLEVWGKRVGCEVVKGKDGADPAGVVFDAVQKGRDARVDVVLVDTAGRLQTKVPLMDELKKIAKSVGKAVEGAPHETLLVIDATNGQNALAQARQFSETLPLTGIILTKLDGTAKGGVILNICDELKVPVRYIGLGERPDDLHEFDAEEFVEALFGEQGKDQASA